MDHKNELIDLKKRKKKLKVIYSDLITEINNKSHFYHELTGGLKKKIRLTNLALKKSIFIKNHILNQTLFFQTLEDHDRKVVQKTNRKLVAIITMDQYDYHRKYEESLIKINEDLNPNYKEDNQPVSEEYYQLIVSLLPFIGKKNFFFIITKVCASTLSLSLSLLSTSFTSLPLHHLFFPLFSPLSSHPRFPLLFILNEFKS